MRIERRQRPEPVRFALLIIIERSEYFRAVAGSKRQLKTIKKRSGVKIVLAQNRHAKVKAKTEPKTVNKTVEAAKTCERSKPSWVANTTDAT